MLIILSMLLALCLQYFLNGALTIQDEVMTYFFMILFFLICSLRIIIHKETLFGSSLLLWLLLIITLKLLYDFSIK